MGYYVGLMEERQFMEPILPGTVLAEMQAIDADVRALESDVASSGYSIATSWPQFQSFVAEWREFYDKYTGGPVAWAARVTNPVIRKVDEYRDRLNGFRAAFVKAGGKSTAVERPAPRVARVNVMPWLLGGGVALGVFLYTRAEGAPRRSRGGRRG